MKRLTVLIAFLQFTMVTFSQVTTEKEKLSDFAEKKTAAYQKQRAKTIRIADSLKIPLRVERENAIIELSHFVNGVPRFISTTNIIAAATTAASTVWPGGAAGLNLSGSGITLGIWDGGRALTSHQEYNGRASQGDGSVSTSSHATHVGGTMIASGVNPAAKGMSFQANLISYDWNDDAGEMANAAANGLQVSNHSYGYLTGWANNYRGDGLWAWFGDTTYSSTTDFGFGAYDITSHEWDTIAWLAPDYLIIKSSGNDRFEGPSTQPIAHWVWNNGDWVLSSTIRPRDGGTAGFDCIPWQGVAKNILTIGAVNDIPAGYQSPSDVILAGFSSTGPTDDGRIKPDLVANGTSLYSSTAGSPTSYASMSGTSMSTPNASGSIGLLLEHHHNLTGNSQFRSATVKGLLIHTANEAGANAGPDYTFGWGLINTRNAALLMSEDAGYGFNFNIRELTLNQNETIRIPVYTNGSQPLTATISWTDRPSEVFTAYANDPTPMLVNDLDIRIIDETGMVTFPWKLDGANPSAAAITGDNSLDNVEKADAGSVEAQHTYLLQITHKANLVQGPQAFSLIISGITTAPSSTSWIGSVSSDWHTSANWSNGTPGAETDVIINDITNNIPVINKTAWCKDLTIGNEGALTVDEGITLNVKGDLLIESDNNGTGSYIGNDPDVNGSKSIERFINGFTTAYNGWHLLSSPVVIQPISDFHTAGSGNDFYKWSENEGLWINRTISGGILNESFETNFTAGNGYLIANAMESTKVFSGSFNDETIEITGLSRSAGTEYAGWNLVGNPFPCAIVWNDGINWNITDEIAGIAKVWDESAASYTDISEGEMIPSANGFMVQLLSESSGTLQIPSIARVHNSQFWFKAANEHIELTAIDNDRGTRQKLIIAFNPESTGKYDIAIDSHFLGGFAPQFYSVAANEKLSTNTLPSFYGLKPISLGFIRNDSEHFSISLTETNIPSEMKIIMVDEFTGVVTDLNTSRDYSFTSAVGDNPDRFTLYLNPVDTLSVQGGKIFNLYAKNSSIYLNLLVNEDVEINITDSHGKQIYKGKTGNRNLFQVYTRGFPPGIYVVNAIAGELFQHEKIVLTH